MATMVIRTGMTRLAPSIPSHAVLSLSTEVPHGNRYWFYTVDDEQSH